MSRRPLNVLQVCDHLGWEGSRMHGVKRLFGWMIPRFDPGRFRVSLVSLRKKDLSEETLEAQGVDVTYLRRSKFDPLSVFPSLWEGTPLTTLLRETSRTTRRKGILRADLWFLTSEAPA
jgi:hypothetical protein